MARKVKATQDRNILEIVKGLLLSEIAFRKIYSKYKEGRLYFTDIGIWVDDKGKSHLYNLKEKCHALYRNKGEKPFQNHQWLLDLVIGSIFHEAMKLRENIYQIEVYRPRYLQYKLRVGKSNYEKDYLQRFERIIMKAKQGVAEGMVETRSLFQDAMAQLVDLIKYSGKNIFLVRFLLENLTLLQKVYGPKRVKGIFNLMFKGGMLEAYELAGRSYLQSEHYDLSSAYFLKAHQLDPYHPDLQFFLNFSNGMKAYYKNAYPASLSYFTRLTSLKLNGKLIREHLKKVEEVCNKIGSELKEEKGLKAASKASALAERIRKCYDKS